jgi:hypothetical protein
MVSRLIAQKREERGLLANIITDQERQLELEREIESARNQQVRLLAEAARRGETAPAGAGGSGLLPTANQIAAVTFGPESQQQAQQLVQYTEALGPNLQEASTQAQQLKFELTEGAKFSQRQTGQFADAFLAVATGAQSAKEATKSFFRSFVADMLRAQAVAASTSLFGGLFGGIFNVFNPANPAQAGQIGSPFAGPVQPFANGGAVQDISKKVKGYAGGGRIASSDTVPAMLTPGEFVMSRSAVDRIGMGNLAAMNSGRAGGGGGNQFSVSVNIQAVDARGVTELIAGDPEGFAGLISNAFARDYNLKGLMTGSAV